MAAITGPWLPIDIEDSPHHVEVIVRWHRPSQRMRIMGLRIEPQGDNPQPISVETLRYFPIRQVIKAAQRA